MVQVFQTRNQEWKEGKSHSAGAEKEGNPSNRCKPGNRDGNLQWRATWPSLKQGKHLTRFWQLSLRCLWERQGEIWWGKKKKVCSIEWDHWAGVKFRVGSNSGPEDTEATTPKVSERFKFKSAGDLGQDSMFFGGLLFETTCQDFLVRPIQEETLFKRSCELRRPNTEGQVDMCPRGI